jgi:hypothetical protein
LHDDGDEQTVIITLLHCDRIAPRRRLRAHAMWLLPHADEKKRGSGRPRDAFEMIICDAI